MKISYFVLLCVVLLLPQLGFSQETLNEEIVRDLLTEKTLKDSPPGTNILGIEIHEIPNSSISFEGNEYWWVPAEIITEEPSKQSLSGGGRTMTVQANMTSRAVYGFYEANDKWSIGYVVPMSAWDYFKEELKK